MTKGQVLEKYGINYMSHCNRNDEADENFEKFVKSIAENFNDKNWNQDDSGDIE